MVLIILMWSLPIALVSAVEINILQAIGREGSAAKSLIIAALATIIFNLLLVPVLGVIGAALATLLGGLAREAMIYSDVKRNFLHGNYISLFIKPSLATLIMGGVTVLCWRLGPYAATVLGFATYIGVIFVSGALKLSELKALAR